ncbi:hypothetical protein G2W53_022197 [Senna tora]|uniref:Uncharacterized protein n=1 Tax=Senna tora TaxID=362788 RepID=A0A834TKS7_9FABA|nr:hypothetical protein G2W53_022197 [Senna tora]
MDKWKKISFNEDESGVIEDIAADPHHETQRVQLCLVGSLWTEGSYNVNAFQSTIKQVWNVRHGVDIRVLGKNLYIFQFYHWKDRSRILKGEPWWFDKRVLALQEMTGDEPPSSIKPSSVPFWVRIHDVPYNLRTLDAAKSIGQKVGIFLEWDNSDYGRWETHRAFGPWLRASPVKIGDIQSKSTHEGGSAKKMLFKPAMESRDQEGVQPINDVDHVFSGVFADVDDGAVPKPGDVLTTEAGLSVVQTLDDCLLTHSKPVAHVSPFHDSITVEGESSVNAKNKQIPNSGVIGSSGVNMAKSPNVIEAFVNLKNEAHESKDGKGRRAKLLTQTKCNRGKQIAEQQRNMKTAIPSTIRQNMDFVDQLFDVHIMALDGVSRKDGKKRSWVEMLEDDSSAACEAAPPGFMSHICWNCRGLGTPRAVRDLKRLNQDKRPSLIFLMETKAKASAMKRLKFQLGFDCVFAVDCSGEGKQRAGGLALFWYNTLDLTLASFSSNHIDVIVSDAGLNIKWRLTGVHGFPEEQSKHQTWDLLRLLASNSDLPWLCYGDFNEIMFASEKQGGTAKSDRSMQAFRDACNHCGFTDMGFKGYPFTWNNGRRDQHNIQERLDRVFATEEWLLKFPYTEVNHISHFSSDHCALEISFDSLPPSNHTRRQRLFRFEEAWCSDERCKDVINAVWQGTDAFSEKLTSVASNLSFMEATLAPNASFTWRCIMKARWVLQLGAGWRVGNGFQINIWEDNWISPITGLRILSPRPLDSDLVMVADLINHENRTWKRDLINSAFPSEARIILSLPLSWRNIQDKFIWPFEKHLSYSVKSAYHIISKNMASLSPSTSSTKVNWARIWKLTVTPKIRIFFWRLCHNALPTCLNLGKRGVQILNECPRCRLPNEDTVHTFIGCTWAQLVWFLSPLGFFPILHSNEAFIDWLHSKLEDESIEVLNWIATVCWAIWNDRNNFLFNAKHVSVEECVHNVLSLMAEYSLHDKQSLSNDPCVSSLISKWKKPKSYFHKLNVDAARLSDTEWSLGAVVRDDCGDLHFVAATRIQCLDDSSIAEALAIRWGLLLVIQLDVTNLEVETDCLIACKSYHDGADDSLMDTILQDCFSLSNYFDHFSLQLVPRGLNQVAHYVAKHLHALCPAVWLSNFPEPVVSLALSDVSS